MNISIFGMGSVGAVCAACFAERGHTVIGVDVSADKISLINAGKSPIVEPGLEELLASGVKPGHLRATSATAEAIENTEMSMICVGTPSKRSGDLDLDYIEAVTREIGEEIKRKNARNTIVVRSTVLPGTVTGLVVPLLEKAYAKLAGVDLGLAFNRETQPRARDIKDNQT